MDLSNEASLRAKLSAWDFFVLRHRMVPNLVVHFFTFLMYWGCLPLAYFTENPWWLLGLPLSGAIAAPSHYVFGDGGVSIREATWDPLVPFFVTILFWRLARGLYWQDVSDAEARYRELAEGGEI